MDKNKKILMLITSLGRGGADRQVIDLSRRINDRNVTIKIVSILPLGDMGIEALNQGLDIESLNIKRGSINIFAIIKMIKIINEFKPDIIHSHMKHSIILGRISKVLSLKLNIKNIDTFHNICSDNEKFRFLIKITNFISYKNTFVSNASLNSYLEKKITGKTKSIVIHNAILDVQVDECNKNPHDNFTIGALGRIHHIKNYDLLIEAFKLFNDKYPNSLLYIAGHGDVSALRKKCIVLDISNQVIFLGPITNLSAFFSKIDLYISTSFKEGFSLSLAEAISYKKLYVVTNSGGINDLIIDDTFVSNSFSKIEIFNLMEKNYLLSKNDRDILINRNYQYIREKFNMDIILDKWLDIYYA